MRHDDVQQSGPPGLQVFIVKTHQPIGGERHHFPRHQEQEGICGSEDDRQAEKQDMVQKAEQADVPFALEFFQIAK